MKSIVCLVALLLLAPTLLVAQAEPRVALVASHDAPGALSAERLNRCLYRLAREWNLPEDKLPHIVVFHVSKRVADTAFIDDTLAVRRSANQRSGAEYYEVWLVGSPEGKYELGLQNVLEYHFQLTPTDEQRTKILAKVERQEEDVFDVHEGK